MEIKQKFWGAFKKNRSIKMINQYQGVPITSQATICMIGPDILALNAHPRQLERIKRERHTYLECSSTHELIKAVPIAVDMQDKIVLLTHFSPAEPTVRQHLHELHIRPKDLVSVGVQLNERAFSATLIDLIKNGNGPLQLRILVGDHPEIHLKAKVGLTFNLSDAVGTVQLNGEVLRINCPRGVGQTYLRILAADEQPLSRQLRDYISSRKVEIETELDSAIPI